MPKPAARASSGRYVSRLTGGALAVIMAGGRGERLGPLTAKRCKPAAPFGGKFRIIDFVLSNCVNSGIRQVMVLTQYKAQSLIQHVQRGWGYLRGEFGEFVDVIPAQQQRGEHWYLGTADSVYQNLEAILGHHPKYVLVLAGDHIYKMDYGPMIAYHVEKGADITVGVVEVPRSEAAKAFGVLTVTDWHRVTKFTEKPADPDAVPGRPDSALASMGIYVFNTRLLEQLLAADAANPVSQHDFGRNIIPDAIERLQVFAYPFQDVKTRAQSYWRDVGTIDAYYEANLELVHVAPELNIYDEVPIWTYQSQQPPAKFVLDDGERVGTAVNSMVAGGAIVSGAQVRESLLFTNVRVNERSSVYRSIILPGVTIGRDCHVRGAIIDEACEVPDGTRIGFDAALDRERFFVTDRGVVLVTAGMLRPPPA